MWHGMKGRMWCVSGIQELTCMARASLSAGAGAEADTHKDEMSQGLGKSFEPSVPWHAPCSYWGTQRIVSQPGVWLRNSPSSQLMMAVGI